MTFRYSQDYSSWCLLVGGLVLVLPLLIGTMVRQHADVSAERRICSREILTIFLVALTVIAFFSISNRILLALDVPNDQRSLVVLNTEIHHLTWGLFILVGVGFSWRWVSGNVMMRRVVVVIHGVGYGCLWDEWFFYMRQDMTDEAYFETSTIVSALLAALCSTLWWFAVASRWMKCGEPTGSHSQAEASRQQGV